MPSFSPVSWEQTLLNALISVLIRAVATITAGKRTAGATRESAEIARRTALDKSRLDDKLAQVRPLREMASQREQLFRYAAGVLELPLADVSRLSTLHSRANVQVPLDSRYRYVGINNPGFHIAIQEYWNADLRMSADLWAFHATQQHIVEWAREQGEPRLSQTRQIAEAERPVRKAAVADALTALHDAVVTLHVRAEAYIRDD